MWTEFFFPKWIMDAKDMRYVKYVRMHGVGNQVCKGRKFIAIRGTSCIMNSHPGASQ